MTRSPNNIDVLRLLAAFSVVWLHSNFILKLSSFEVGQISYVNSILVSWAMPFFYMTIAYFSMKSFSNSDASKLLSRVSGLARMLIIYGVGIELIRVAKFLLGQNPDYISSKVLILNSDFTVIFQNLVSVIKTGNYSALYFLFYAIVIGFFALMFIRLSNYLGIFLVHAIISTLLIVSIFFNFDNWMGKLILLDRSEAVVNSLVGFFLYLLFSRLRLVNKMAINKSSLSSIVIFSPLLLFWTLKYFDFSLELIWILMGILVFGLFNLFSFKFTDSLKKLSFWGAEYSLGVYLLHPFVFAVLDNSLAIMLSQYLGLSNIPTLVILNLTSMVLSLISAGIVMKKYPMLVKF